MQHKIPPCPQRLRRVPRQFSWIDQRLVRDGLIRRCDSDALALYLFLVTVADAQGLSYYSSHAIAHHLSLSLARFNSARHSLIVTELIAFTPPLYQVLSLDPSEPVSLATRTARPQSLGTLLKQALEKQS